MGPSRRRRHGKPRRRRRAFPRPSTARGHGTEVCGCESAALHQLWLAWEGSKLRLGPFAPKSQQTHCARPTACKSTDPGPQRRFVYVEVVSESNSAGLRSRAASGLFVHAVETAREFPPSWREAHELQHRRTQDSRGLPRCAPHLQSLNVVPALQATGTVGPIQSIVVVLRAPHFPTDGSDLHPFKVNANIGLQQRARVLRSSCPPDDSCETWSSARSSIARRTAPPLPGGPSARTRVSPPWGV